MMRKLRSIKFLFGLGAVLFFSQAQAQINYKAINASNTSGTWSDITASGTSISLANFDDANSGPEDIGFTFDYNGQSYTKFILNTNGFIKLGSAAPSSTNIFYTGAQTLAGGVFAGASSADTNMISAFNMDLEGGVGQTSVKSITTGNSGSQVCTIQWTNFRDKTTNPAIQYDNIKFQIKLYEGSNLIEIVYGPYTASGNANNFKTAGVGLKGSSNTDVVTVTKGSQQAWSLATIQDGGYAGNAFNNRNNFLTDSGRTIQFVPTYQHDMAITNIYTLGKMPVPYATPHLLEARFANIGKDTFTGFYVYLRTTGTNTYLDSAYYSGSLVPGSADFVTFSNYSPSLIGIDSVIVELGADDNKMNDSKIWMQDVNLNSYSYTEALKGPSGGVGFNGASGDFVAKFNSTSANYINQIKVNFTTNNLNYNIGIWEVDASTGAPGTNLWTSSQGQTFIGQAVLSVNPPVAVNGSFFVGVLQTGTTNVGFAFQTEAPIRDSTFYFTSPTGNTTWNDFSTFNSNFRFMIEPRLMIPKDAGVIKIVSPTKDTCGGGGLVDLTLQVQNLGTDTIDLSVDSIAVYATTKDPNGSVTTHGPKYISTGILVSNDTLDVTVTNQFDMTLLGDYEISGYTVWANDSNYQNDTIPLEIRQSTGATSIVSALTNTSICNGDTVVLSGGMSVNGILYQWLYNGTAINNANDTQYYATSAGDYTLGVVNGFGCTDLSDTITVTLKNTPSPSLVYTSAGFCPNDSLEITASTNANNYTYQWIYNGSPLSGKTDSVIYASAAGDYMCEVTDTATGCKSISGVASIQAYSSPDTAITITGAVQFCQGDSVNLAAVAPGGYSYQWNMNGTAINGATNSDYYASANGTYTVTITSNNGCIASNNGVNVDVDPAPSTTITSSNGTFHFCDLDTLGLFAPTGNGYTYQWNDIGGAIFGETNRAYTVFSAGDYSVTVTSALGCSATSNMVTVTSSSSPMPDIKSIANPQFCEGDSILLEAATIDTGYTYQWVLNGTNLNGKSDTTAYITAGGDYSLKITSGGCTGESLPLSIVMLTGPKPVAQAKNNTSLCAGDSVELDVTAQSSVQTIQWRFNGTDISGANATNHFAAAAGTYTAYVVATNQCAGLSNGISITVNPLPTATITYGSKTLSANTGAGLSYQWYKDGLPIAGATSATYSPSVNGTYYVVVTDGNGCDKKSNDEIVKDLGFALAEFVSNMNVYPNPSTGVYTLNLEMNNGGKVRVKVTDIAGRIINDATIQVNKGSNVQTINISEYAKGVYMLNIEMNGSNATLRLIKE